MIIDRHDGAISDITICLNSYEAVNALDPQKTLDTQGITADAEQTLIYDFKPFSHPLLTTPLTSKESEDQQKKINNDIINARQMVTEQAKLTQY